MEFTDKQLVNKAMGALGRLGIPDVNQIAKAASGVIDTSVDFGGYLPVSAAIELINLTRKNNVWLNSITNKTKTRNSGTFTVRKLSEPVMEGVGENEGKEITSKPTTYQVPFRLHKYRADIYMTTEELQDAAQGGMANFQNDMRSDFGIALGNDIADLTMNSDITLGTATRRDRLLNQTDGVRKLMNGGNVHDAGGKQFDQDIFPAIQRTMPQIYRRDPNLQWMYNDDIEIEWTKSLTNVNTTERTRSALGDRAISTPATVPPLGKSQLIVPQIGNDEGPAAIAPTSAADDGDGTITVVLTTMLTAGYFASVVAAVDRTVRVVYLPTGIYEDLLVINNTVAEIRTAGDLGQDTISTNAAEYSVQIVDETSLYYMNPKGIYSLMGTAIRAFREFNKDFDRIEITTYIQMDIQVPILEDKVVFQRVTTPTSIWV